MGKKKYLLNFWNNFFLVFSIVFFIQLFYSERQEKVNNDLSEFMTTNPRYKSVNVMYDNNEYHVLCDENSLYFAINESRSLDNKITSFSSRDIILVDSATFDRLKDYIVIPHPKIDSIYRQMGLRYLLDTFFVGNIPKAYIEYDTLSTNQIAELNYVMDILIRQDFIFFCDCESGIPILLPSVSLH